VFTREAFQEQRQAAKVVERRESRVLVVVSVGLGVAQLALIAWADRHLARGPRLTVEGGVFLAYIALVAWLLWRLVARVRAARPICPQCGARLEGMSERVAAATGRCDGCGGQVIASPSVS